MLGNVAYNLEFFQSQTDCAILIDGSALHILVESRHGQMEDSVLITLEAALQIYEIL